MFRVTLDGWTPGLNKIGLNRLFRSEAGYSLAEAKLAVDRLLDGESVDLEFSDGESAPLFYQVAVDLGAIGSVGLVETTPTSPGIPAHHD